MTDDAGRIGWFDGCEVCRSRWTRTPGLELLGEPRDLGESMAAQAHIYKCGMCGSYWVGDAYHPVTISQEDARRYLPDLAERERDAGLRD